jgi:hypothetical protein
VAAESEGHPADLDELVEILYDENDQPINWLLLEGVRQRNFACVQAGWVNTKAAVGVGSRVSETVSVKTCDYDDASTAAGDAFNVQTVPRRNLDTALFTNYIIEWATAPNGDKVIVSDIWDDPIGIVKWESVDIANIRDGWRLCDGSNGSPDLSGRFIMSIDQSAGAETDENGIGDTGGERDHGAGTNDHTAHSDDLVAAAIANHAASSLEHAAHGIADHATGVRTVTSGSPDTLVTPGTHSYTEHAAGVDDHGPLTHTSSVGVNDLQHSTTDNRPRFYVLAAIQRFE